MKWKVFLIAGLLLIPSAAYADENHQTWVRVDANGNAIGGPIVCSQAVCGDTNSTYAQDTLNPGERYVQQSNTPNGIGNNTPGVTVKVDLETERWTVITDTAQRIEIEALPQPTSDKPAELKPVITGKTVNVETISVKQPELNGTQVGLEVDGNASVTTPEPQPEITDWEKWLDTWWADWLKTYDTYLNELFTWFNWWVFKW